MKKMFHKICFFIFIIQGIWTFAQSHHTIDFENMEGIVVTDGIIGKAFDLGDVARRYAIDVPNPMYEQTNFTVTVWVKAMEEGRSAYTIVSSLKETDMGYDGWKLGIQANGAWNFVIISDEKQFTYNPTPERQSIRDGKWHLLAVSYDITSQDLSFYYDGLPLAIYNAPGLESANLGEKVVIGNAIDTKKPYKSEQWESFYGAIDDIGFSNIAMDPREISKMYSRVTGKEQTEIDAPLADLTLTSFNIWHGGNESGKEAGFNRIMQLLKESNSDVFALVETYGSGEKIADGLGYYLYLISSNLSIISRYPIVDTHLVYNSFNSGGATIALPNGKHINIFNVWLHYLPDYWSGFMKDEKWNVKDFLVEENKTRGKEIQNILSEITPFLNNSDKVPVLLSGDFNSGSHLDWTKENKEAHNGYVVPWPASLAMEANGFKDAWRVLYPKVKAHPGITWSPLYTSDTYIKDRIDFVYYKGLKLKPVKARLIEDHALQFPSDHAGVTVEFKLLDDF
ncbi:Exonuclease III [Arenibacter nanhaiticus]|uniref:Exonuclease III n=1 Tax=Arenibacter nanhaiticus TaxID=558155 RepID=A0A1M6CE00_9FLAO|nr:LamG-like jellyroll fold domain-containing protein [Arenibacter nanhaiticus]SHI59270.1 Exonuclease III [Arenibacter nanhaiticus]